MGVLGGQGFKAARPKKVESDIVVNDVIQVDVRRPFGFFFNRRALRRFDFRSLALSAAFRREVFLRVRLDFMTDSSG